MTPRNNAQTTPRGRPFERGNPGRRKGARHRVTLAVEALLEGEAEAITRRAVEAAKGGDMVAIKLVLDRIAPPPKERAVTADLPALNGPQDAPAIAGALIHAAASGALAPGEAETMMKLVEGYRRAVETADLEARIAALEQHRKES